MALEQWLAGAVMVSLVLYVLGGGADFGGGVWDLLATGERRRAQRDLIAHAIGPIWEANHVWLILAVVLLSVCFPIAWAAISTALHVPLAALLVGIVLRGSAFAFRSYGDEDEAAARRWGRVFAIASTVSPVMLGVCVGAIAADGIRFRDGRLATGFLEAWMRPFPWAVGAMTLALFAFLAAVYLTNETRDAGLQEDFRRRALGAGIATGVFAFGALALAREQAPLVWSGLTRRAWSLPFHAVTALTAVAALVAVARRAYRLARGLAIGQAILVMWGWGLSQYPWLLPPDVTFAQAAAPPAVLRPVLAALGVGAIVLVPSLVYLFHVFKVARH